MASQLAERRKWNDPILFPKFELQFLREKTEEKKEERR